MPSCRVEGRAKSRSAAKQVKRDDLMQNKYKETIWRKTSAMSRSDAKQIQKNDLMQNKC